jgi:hypothetical protein
LVSRSGTLFPFSMAARHMVLMASGRQPQLAQR